MMMKITTIVAFLLASVGLVACGGGGSGTPQTGDTVAPSAPTNLTATAISATQINLAWTASTDDVGVTGYEVWRGTTKISTVTATSYNDIGLISSTTYTYSIKAFDEANNISAASGPASATTSASLGTSASIKLPKTGQTTCYDSAGAVKACANTGQDGALQQGVEWPNPRFTDNGNNTVTDNLTGLNWSKDGNAPGPVACSPAVGKTWEAALDYVACLNTNSYLGYTDWRLPNKKELRSLVNYGQAIPATWLNTQGFTNVQDRFYWSSTSYAVDASSAWGINIGSSTGSGGGGGHFQHFSKTYDFIAWPVRTGQSSSTAPAKLPKTGQTTCYDSAGAVISCATTAGQGQDGALQQGVEWPNPRFTDNGNNTVTDNLTGLNWSKDGNAPGPVACSPAVGKTWQAALDYVACLNTNSYLGYTDWRLPDVNELESLTHASQSNTATWLNTQGVTNAQGGSQVFYWSSTSHANNAVYAWYVMMSSGDGQYMDKTYSGHVWPVRSGQ